MIANEKQKCWIRDSELYEIGIVIKTVLSGTRTFYNIENVLQRKQKAGTGVMVLAGSCDIKVSIKVV